MEAKFYKYLFLSILFVFVGILHSKATHIRAGEITMRRVSNQTLTYEITVTGYADKGSSVLFGSNGTLDYGDGTFEQINNDGESSSVPRVSLDDETWVYTLKRTHTFPSQGTYIVSFREFYRNEGVLNMDNSVNMPFYIETVIVIDGFLGVNNTPQLLVPPVDRAGVGRIYIHNPGAFDVDGDSLSYRLVFCKQDENTPVANYRFPDETFPEGNPKNGSAVGGGEPTFTLDPVTGDLVWDSPGTKGEYNAAFLIEEWRKVNGEYYFLGYVTRDMQIIVKETENEPPVLTIPNDTCIIAGTTLRATITADDPDGDRVKIESYGGVYASGATYTPNNAQYQSLPAKVDFEWKTSCKDVRTRPYPVQFKATDEVGSSVVSLTDIKTWNITVIAPAPDENSFSVQEVNSRTIDVNFNRQLYACGNQAVKMQVWRRVNSYNFEPGYCETGMPEGTGYELVSERGITDFPFRDNNNGKGLVPGAAYCYRLVAVFPQPQGGESIVSVEKCVTLPAAVPIITNVSVEKTASDNGEIFVRWAEPIDTDGIAPPPYTYDVYREEGFSGGAYQLVRENISDTSFVDTGLDTENKIYNYYVMLKKNDVEVDSSATASSVRLEPESLVGAIELNWEAEVPWSNHIQKYPYHYIYRDQVDEGNPNQLVLIDSVNVTQRGFTYLDKGEAVGKALNDTTLYCYFVVTQGSYGNPRILEPLLNNSQVICAQPNDTIPPCGPIAFELMNPAPCEQLINELPCSGDVFQNKLVWTANTDESCQNDIAFWEIYFSATDPTNLENFALIGTTRNNVFIHEDDGDDEKGLSSLAGYYYLVAVDRSGNRSQPSNIVMNDNCPRYMLPNVFTPNNDDINDIFGASRKITDLIPCPRFVESVKFKVYNRWGKEVYSYSYTVSKDNGRGKGVSGIYIDWNGRGNNGEKLTAGTYYYSADVTFNVLDPKKKKQTLKGTVTILYGTENRSPGEGGR